MSQHEENKIFIHQTVEEWWDSLWNHGIRAKLEQLSPQQLNIVQKNVITKAESYIEKHIDIISL